MKKLGFLILLANIAFADNLEIANALKNIAKSHNIDKRVLYTIAKIESNFTPNIIAFKDSKKWKINNPKLKVTNAPYKNGFLISIKGDKDELIRLTRFLIESKKSVDVGLMQINSVNFTKNELGRIFDLEFNILKGVGVLRSCQKHFRAINNIIECYNKGTKLKSKVDYYTRFYKSFERDFKNIYF